MSELTEEGDALAVTTSEQWGRVNAHVSPLCEVGEWDEHLMGFTVRETDEWIVTVTPMTFNNRIVLTHRDEYPWMYRAGWCYDKGPAAFLAAAAWNPDEGGEPAGFKKRAGE